MPILVNIFTLKKSWPPYQSLIFSHRLISVIFCGIFNYFPFWLFSLQIQSSYHPTSYPIQLFLDPKSTINWGQLCTCKLYTGLHKNRFRNQYWKSGSLAVTTRFNLRCYWASSKSQTIKVNLSNGLHWPWLMDGTEIVRWFTCN